MMTARLSGLPRGDGAPRSAGRAKLFLAGLLAVWGLVWAGPAHAEWPERGLTMVAPVSEKGDQSGFKAGELAVFKAMAPRLSRELGVPVAISEVDKGWGLAAVNLVAVARPDGYTFGALPSEAAITWELQTRTPYIWAELLPLATGWEQPHVLLCRQDFKYQSLEELAQAPDRAGIILAHQGTDPMTPGLIEALAAGRQYRIDWRLEYRPKLDVALLLSSQADLMVWPLTDFQRDVRARLHLKALALLASAAPRPNAAGLSRSAPPLLAPAPDSPHPRLAFYLPAKTSLSTANRLSAALTNVLDEPAVVAAMEKAGLLPAVVVGVEARKALEQEYQRQKSVLADFGLL